MGEFLSWLKAINGLTAGARIGGVLGCVLYLVVRNHYEATELIFVAALGAATGTAVQSLLQYLLKPRLDRREFDKDLNELDTLHKNGRINKKTYQEIINDLVRQRFLHK
jgi:hypothetical protein